MPGNSELTFEGTERFEIRRRLGAGGMGVVYEAFDRERNVRCALKTLRRVDARTIYRFKNEFRALLGIQHPNLVSFGELFEVDGNWFFTMELIEGHSFLEYVRGEESAMVASSSGDRVAPSADTMRAFAVQSAVSGTSGSYDEARLRDALRQLALGLDALHKAGMVHRDIKPSNIRVTKSGRVVLLDFGLVARSTSDSTTGAVVGTAAYMAPEQATSRAPGARADWYSVGVVLYEALTGRVPFSGSAVKVLMDKQRRTPPPPRARVPNVAPDLDELCVSLLHFDPDARPSAQEIFESLGADERPPPSAVTMSTATQTPPFVGRTSELERLRAAYDASRRGTPVVVLVHGQSGVGKSELVRQFTDTLVEAEDELVLLRGRCYEQESVPYKAFDGIADALSRYMVRLSDRDAAELLPLRPSLLPQLFPVLSRVEAIARAPRESVGVSDPQELRTRMFDALRELLIRISQRRRLVLVIDDLHWADVDSLTLLSEILHPPDAPNLLLIATSRRRDIVDDDSQAPFGREISDVDLREIRVEQLDAAHARELVSVLSPMLSAQPDVVGAIAREAGGVPLFIMELVRQVEEQGLPESGTARLDDALWSRVVRAPRAARALLEVLAVAGAPISREVAAHATRQDPAQFEKSSSMLRLMSMALSGGLRPLDPIECSHDRVRSAVLSKLTPFEQTNLHRRLAIAFARVGAGRSDPHALVRHLEAAGQTQEAAQHAAEAGARAAAMLAFDQAAAFYRKALLLGEHEPSVQQSIRLQLAEALANLGRGGEAAEAFLAAAEDAEPATRLRCQQRAAEQLLLSGHIEQGLEATAALLGELGVSMPATPRRALVSLLWHRLRLRVRGLRWKPKHENDVPQRDLTRLDAYKAVAHGLSMVDTIRGSDFQARSLLLAVRTGEPARVGRALTMEAAIQASQGHDRRARLLVGRARKIAADRDDPYLHAFNTVVDGVICYFEGEFVSAAEACATGEAMYREQPGTAWERSSAQLFRLLALRLMGNINELREQYAIYLRDALRRGDRYLETTVRRYCNIVWMAADDPDAARLNLERATWMPGAAFHLQHWYELEAEAELELYTGDVSLDHFRDKLEALRRSLLPRIETVRTLSRWLVGRLALLDSSEDDRVANRVRAGKMARLLLAEPTGYPAVWGLLLQAALAASDGDAERAAPLLRQAIELADQREMALIATAARHRLGELVGGDEGAALIDHADTWLAAQGVVNPARLLRVVVPGFDRR